MLQYKSWLHDDHLANHAEYFPIPRLASWKDHAIVLWAFLLIVWGELAYKVRQLF